MDAPRITPNTSGSTSAMCSSDACALFSRRAVNQKVLPRPGWLYTPTLPPMSSTSCLLITSPRPLPPYLRVVDGSAWWKERNSCATSSCFMPMPRSCTSKRSMAWLPRSSDWRTRTKMLPLSENLMALLVRFSKTCSRRSGSPRTVAGSDSSMCSCSASECACARDW
ncbi:hypothetical protein D3C72_1638990 [compost metagenome]